LLTGSLVNDLSELFKRKQKDLIVERLANFDKNINTIDILNNDVYIGFEGINEMLPLGMSGDGLRRFLNIVASSANPMTNVILIDEIDLPVIVDAGIGRPSQACEAMEMGAAAVMSNTALATAGDLPVMAEAFRKAVEAGRQAYLSGLGRVLVRGASPSDTLTGFLHD